MANNRMWLRCMACGDEFMLGKHMGREWYHGRSGDPGYARELHDFLVEHGDFCHHYEHENVIEVGEGVRTPPHEEMFALVYEGTPWIVRNGKELLPRWMTRARNSTKARPT